MSLAKHEGKGLHGGKWVQPNFGVASFNAVGELRPFQNFWAGRTPSQKGGAKKFLSSLKTGEIGQVAWLLWCDGDTALPGVGMQVPKSGGRPRKEMRPGKRAKTDLVLLHY